MGLLRWLTAAATLTPPAAPLPIGSPWADGDQLTRITFDSLFPGAEAEWWPISRREAMTVPAVAAARHRVVGTLSRLPLIAEKDDKPYTAGSTGLLDQPDNDEPHVTTMRTLMDDLFFYGLGWWAVVAKYAEGGRPASVVSVPLTEVTTNDDGVPTLSSSFIDKVARVRGYPVLADPRHAGRPWLIRFDGPHEGICNIGGRAIRSALNLDRAAQHAADNPVPSIELHQTTDADLSDAEIMGLIGGWQDSRRRGGVGYTNAAIDLRTHGQQPEQLLIDGRNQQAVEVARLAGIPAASIDAGIPGTSLTYANLGDRLADLIQFGLSPYDSAVTSRLSMNDCLPDGVRARFDYAKLYPAPPAGAPGSAAPAATPAPPTPLRSVS